MLVGIVLLLGKSAEVDSGEFKTLANLRVLTPNVLTHVGAAEASIVLSTVAVDGAHLAAAGDGGGIRWVDTGAKGIAVNEFEVDTWAGRVDGVVNGDVGAIEGHKAAGERGLD